MRNASLERSGRPKARLDAGVTESPVFERIVVEPVETTVLSKMAQKKIKNLWHRKVEK